MSRYVPKVLTFLLSLVPAIYIGYEIWLASTGQPNGLGPDPGRAIELSFGQWGLRFLLITLAVTPIRQIAGWTRVARLRRMLGLFAFLYIALHLASYLIFVQQLNPSGVLHDIAKHPYVLVGFTAFCAMVPLAATSNDWMMRRLKQRWKTLHRLVYVIVVLGLVHLFWLTRSSYFEVSVYAGITAALLGYRVYKSPLLRRFLRRFSDLRDMSNDRGSGIAMS